LGQKNMDPITGGKNGWGGLTFHGFNVDCVALEVVKD
jgi:hypothetical protein